MSSRDVVLPIAAGAALSLSAFSSRSLARLAPNSERAVASFAGGVSITYVVLQLLVELFEDARYGAHAALPIAETPLRTLVLLLLLGMVVYTLVQSYAARRAEGPRSYAAVVVPFAIYSMLVGAALVDELHHGLEPFLLYVAAMALHLTVSDHQLSVHFPHEHHGAARAAVVLAPMTGVIAWTVLSPPENLFDVMLAIVAGGTLLYGIREELPAPTKLRPGAFLAGVAVFFALIALRVRA